MKTKILSILLTVAMLVAMVPMIAVSAEEETGTVYPVGSIAEVVAFIADTTTKNVAGNTMKLTADLDYTGDSLPVYTDKGTNYVDGMWTGLKANVDGNGHTVKVPGGSYYWGWILCDLDDSTEGTKHIFENLKIVMPENESAAKTGSFIGLFGRNFEKNNELVVKNCYFDLKLQGGSRGSGALFGELSAVCSATITVKNSCFKVDNADGGVKGVLVGKRFSNTGSSEMVYNISNCVFYANDGVNIIGDVFSGSTGETYKTTINADNNLICTGAGVYGSTLTAGFTKVTAGENPVTTVTGYQTTTVANDQFDLRLVGLVDLGEEGKLADYTKVGFIVEASYGATPNTITKWMNAASTKVYTSLKGYEGEPGLVEYTAEELGGNYLYALAIKNIPAAALEGEGITFTVKPYYVDTNGNAMFGAEETFTVTSVPSDSANVAA